MPDVLAVKMIAAEDGRLVLVGVLKVDGRRKAVKAKVPEGKKPSDVIRDWATPSP